jgi:hypothetical protein
MCFALFVKISTVTWRKAGAFPEHGAVSLFFIIKTSGKVTKELEKIKVST